jgi:hypothetical protein
MSPSAPLYVTDAAGVRFRVFDVLSGPPDVPGSHIRVVAAGHLRAHFRLFESPAGVVYPTTVGRDPWGDRRPYCPDATNLAERWLHAQLEEARRYPPDDWGAAMLAEARTAARRGRPTLADVAIASSRGERINEAPDDAAAGTTRTGPEPLPAGYIPRRERGTSRRAGR